MQIESIPLGVHSVSACFFLTDRDDEVELSIGPGVIRWNLPTSQRVFTKQLHNALISDMQKFLGYNLTCGWDSHIRLWTLDYEPKASAKVTDLALVSRISVFDDMVLVNASNGFRVTTEGEMSIWKFIEGEFFQLSRIKADYRNAFFTKDGKVVSFVDTPLSIEIRDPKDLSVMETYTTDISDSDTDDIIWYEACDISERYIVAVLQTLEICVFNAQTLELERRFDTNGTSSLWCIALYNNLAAFVPSEKILTVVDISTGETVGIFSCPSGYVYSIKWQTRYCILLATTDGFHAVALDLDSVENPLEATQTQMMGVQFAKMASCGVDFSPSGKAVASGDLSCGVHLWEIPSLTYTKYTIPDMVRCVQYLNEEIVLIGGLQGSLCKLCPPEDPQRIHLFQEGSITTIRNAHNIPGIFSLSLTSGHFFIMQYDFSDGIAKLLTGVLAHPAVNIEDPIKREKFPSLHHQADCWTICWHPDDTFIATGSEDQTVKIWKVETHTMEPKLVVTLRGHTTAVTCVDWVHKKDSKETILASCADDQTVRIWNTTDYNCIAVFKEQGITGWHTYTYIRIDSRKELIYCTTVNGFLIIFDLDGRCHYAECLHKGSIEGISFSDCTDQVAICGADCITSIHKISYENGDPICEDKSGPLSPIPLVRRLSQQLTQSLSEAVFEDAMPNLEEHTNKYSLEIKIGVGMAAAVLVFYLGRRLFSVNSRSGS